MLGAVGGVLLLSACQSQSQQAEKKQQTIHSWEATLRMTDSAAARHGVPHHFADKVHETAREEIAKARQQ